MRAWAVLLATALAACASPPQGTDAMVPAEDAGADALKVVLGGADCAGLAVAVLADFSRTDPWLPSGFHPRDARDLLGLPAATGKAVVFLASLHCQTAGADGMGMATLGIHVEPPNVQGVNASEGFSLYEVAKWTTEPDLVAQLDDVGWHVDPLEIDPVQVQGIPGGAWIATASARAENGTYFELTGGGPGRAAANLLRIWHDTPDGIGYMEWDLLTEATLGPGACALDPASLAAAIIGHAHCPPSAASATQHVLPDTTLAFVLPAFDMDAHIRFLPGVHAQ